ncbi:MAG: aquaporin [Pirellulales bacterium]|nr:aquaporin [Pirellulales bacterium]
MDKTFPAAVAEFLGTFTLVFLGAGAGALAGSNGAGIVGVALAHGFALVVIIYTWGWISGAHVNPAVTLALLLTGKIDIGKSIVYWIAQMAGGAAAGYLLLYILGPDSDLGQTLGSLSPGKANADPTKLVVVEAVLTFFLICAVFANGVALKSGNIIGVAIAFTLVADILMGGALTGASMNPARTFGPALAKNDLSYLHLYIIGPAIGAVVGGILYNVMFLSNEPEQR